MIIFYDFNLDGSSKIKLNKLLNKLIRYNEMNNDSFPYSCWYYQVNSGINYWDMVKIINEFNIITDYY